MDRLDESVRVGRSTGVLPTSGAITVTREDGKVTMEKVKVSRYIAGQRWGRFCGCAEFACVHRPAYAASDSDSENERRRERRQREQQHRRHNDVDVKQIFDNVATQQSSKKSRDKDRRHKHRHRSSSSESGVDVKKEDIDDDYYRHAAGDSRLKRAEENDRRLKRLQAHRDDKNEVKEVPVTSRRVASPEIVERRKDKSKKSAASGSASSASDDGGADAKNSTHHDDKLLTNVPSQDYGSRPPRHDESDRDSDDSDVDDETLARRRELLRARALQRQEEELMTKQADEDKAQVTSEESSGGEDGDDYTDSDDDAAPRLKPVFVRKRDRVTLQESEKEAQRLQELQLEEKRVSEQRKRDSQKMVENLVKRELEMEAKRKTEDIYDLTQIVTDDESEEVAYEEWKVRELKRIKRDKDEEATRIREKAEWDRVHNMTEEERREYLRQNPKIVTNKQEKGKMRFMQKWFHRGAFYLDEDEDIFKRNFMEATLEDRFDKTVLPKIMQVKDFGKQGRTKWTHLVGEDTTDFQTGWAQDSTNNIKFFAKHAGGVKEVFTRPEAKKRKKD